MVRTREKMGKVRWSMSVTLLPGSSKHDEILEEARVEPIVMVLRRRLEWFGNEKDE